MELLGNGMSRFRLSEEKQLEQQCLVPILRDRNGKTDWLGVLGQLFGSSRGGSIRRKSTTMPGVVSFPRWMATWVTI